MASKVYTNTVGFTIVKAVVMDILSILRDLNSLWVGHVVQAKSLNRNYSVAMTRLDAYSKNQQTGGWLETSWGETIASWSKTFKRWLLLQKKLYKTLRQQRRPFLAWFRASPTNLTTSACKLIVPFQCRQEIRWATSSIRAWRDVRMVLLALIRRLWERYHQQWSQIQP